MDTAQDNSQWHLIRNNRGEWISEEHVMFLSKLEVAIHQVWANRLHLPLNIQNGPDGRLWCYRHEVEAINAAIPKAEQPPVRKLKISRR